MTPRGKFLLLFAAVLLLVALLVGTLLPMSRMNAMVQTARDEADQSRSTSRLRNLAPALQADAEGFADDIRAVADGLTIRAVHAARARQTRLLRTLREMRETPDPSPDSLLGEINALESALESAAMLLDRSEMLAGESVDAASAFDSAVGSTITTGYLLLQEETNALQQTVADLGDHANLAGRIERLGLLRYLTDMAQHLRAVRWRAAALREPDLLAGQLGALDGTDDALRRLEASTPESRREEVQRFTDAFNRYASTLDRLSTLLSRHARLANQLRAVADRIDRQSQSLAAALGSSLTAESAPADAGDGPQARLRGDRLFRFVAVLVGVSVTGLLAILLTLVRSVRRREPLPEADQFEPVNLDRQDRR